MSLPKNSFAYTIAIYRHLFLKYNCKAQVTNHTNL